jgi:hypothetical protein
MTTLQDAGRNERKLVTLWLIVDWMNGMNNAVPPPKPAAMMPEASPRAP